MEGVISSQLSTSSHAFAAPLNACCIPQVTYSPFALHSCSLCHGYSFNSQWISAWTNCPHSLLAIGQRMILVKQCLMSGHYCMLHILFPIHSAPTDLEFSSKPAMCKTNIGGPHIIVILSFHFY